MADLENDPAVFEVNLSEMPIAVYSLSGTCGLPCLKDVAEDLKDDIEGIAGVLVFGLMVATFLTLLVVPTLYLFLDDLSVMRKNALFRIQQFAGRFRVAFDSSAKS